jgi:hypothetical protein
MEMNVNGDDGIHDFGNGDGDVDGDDGSDDVGDGDAPMAGLVR